MKNCFVVCPIGSENSETRKRSDMLFRHVISPVCKECDFTPIRIDNENTNGSLTDEIISHIDSDDLVIADLTDSNPNAFYEIGYRAALKKPAIHLVQKILIFHLMFRLFVPSCTICLIWIRWKRLKTA